MASALGTINATAYWTPNGGAKGKVPHVRSWETEGSADNPEYASADTGKFKARCKGPKDRTFSIECYRDALYTGLTFAEGDVGTVDLEADGPSKAEQLVAAIIDSITVNTNPETGEPMGLTIAGSRFDSALPAP